MRQIERFLSNVSEPSIGAKAASHGYDGDEHKYGWQQYALAVGMNRPFEHYLSQAEVKALLHASPMTVERYRVLDQFENTWFPRTRAALDRYIEPAQREVFIAAFYKDLKQQAEGPLVVGSVALFLTRLQGLQSDAVVGSTQAYAALVKKGLTDSLQAQIAELIDQAKSEAEPAPDARVSAATIAQGNQEQRAAFDLLRLWYNDWATTLRSELSYHQLLRLGLVTVGGHKADPETPLDEAAAALDSDGAPVGEG